MIGRIAIGFNRAGSTSDVIAYFFDYFYAYFLFVGIDLQHCRKVADLSLSSSRAYLSPYLRDMIARTGTHSTNLEGAESPELLCSRCKAYADAWRPRAEQI